MTINVKGVLLDFSEPKIMGILNITPDSFYAGSRFVADSEILCQAEKMLKEGAAMIDIGGMSSRPGAEIISAEEELNRVLPQVKNILQEFPQTIISIDTIHAKTADECLQSGAHIVNDISAACYDEQMIPVVAKHKAPLILMHTQGMPADMQQNPQYKNVVTEIADFLEERISACRKAGILDVIIDVGFCFGKTVEHNYNLLRNLKYFTNFQVPIMAGLSRKTMIYKPLGVTPQEALNATTALNTVALLNGANILRVHDVKEAAEIIKLKKMLQ